MLVVWQGYGYIALVAAFLPLAACAGLFDIGTGVGLLGAGVGFLLGGVICVLSSRGLRKASARREAEARAERDPENPHRAGGAMEAEPPHTLYFVPLWVWGWVYILFGLFVTAGALVRIFTKGWKN